MRSEAPGAEANLHRIVRQQDLATNQSFGVDMLAITTSNAVFRMFGLFPSVKLWQEIPCSLTKIHPGSDVPLASSQPFSLKYRESRKSQKSQKKKSALRRASPAGRDAGPSRGWKLNMQPWYLGASHRTRLAHLDLIEIPESGATDVLVSCYWMPHGTSTYCKVRAGKPL